jgi:hypothetical protein
MIGPARMPHRTRLSPAAGRRAAQSAAPLQEGPVAAIQRLQETAGNAAVSALLDGRAPAAVQRQGPAVADPAQQGATQGAQVAPGAGTELPSWSAEQLRRIQRELTRLGMYTMRIDGIYGRGTEVALVESFGGDEWRRLDPEAILGRLTDARPPAGGKRGEHRLQYGEMFKDGVLDMTLGIGFDEGGSHVDTIATFSEVLSERGFVQDRGAAARIYKQAGRELPDSAFGQFFVRENALTYQPPAGDARQVHAVVRLIANRDGEEGAQARDAFMQGMAQSDVSYYSGHGRYGSGPDFDRNMRIFVTEEGRERQLGDYDELEVLCRKAAHGTGRSTWAQFLWMESRGLVRVETTNSGNVYMNPEDEHSAEFGAKLMYWALKKSGATPVTGKGNELEQGAAQNPERRYRLMVFDGCRTRDYARSLRSTKGFDTRSADVLDTQRTLNWGDEARTLAAFLDEVLAQQSAESIVRDMDVQQSPENPGGRQGGAYTPTGFGDNPVQR